MWTKANPSSAASITEMEAQQYVTNVAAATAIRDGTLDKREFTAQARLVFYLDLGRASQGCLAFAAQAGLLQDYPHNTAGTSFIACSTPTGTAFAPGHRKVWRPRGINAARPYPRGLPSGPTGRIELIA